MNVEKLERWTADADKALRPVTAHEHDLMVKEVNDGIAELYRVDNDSWLITKIDDGELVVCCYIGKDIEPVADLLWKAAHNANCHSIRFHTQRPGLNRMMKKYDFECEGLFYIYRREL